MGVCLFREVADHEHEGADLAAEFRRAVHDQLAALGGGEHIVRAQQDAQRALEGVKAQGKEGHGALVFAAAGAGFAGFDADERRHLGVVVDRQRINAVRGFERPLVDLGMPHLVQLADAAREQIEHAFDQQPLILFRFGRFRCAEDVRHLQQRHHEGGQRGSLFDAVDLRDRVERDLALEEGVHLLDALELQLNVGILGQAGVHQPFAAVDHEMHADLALGAVGIKGADLNDGVRMLEFLLQLRHVGRKHLHERKRGVEKYFIGI